MSIPDENFGYNDPVDALDDEVVHNFDTFKPVSESTSNFGNSEEFKFNFTDDQN